MKNARAIGYCKSLNDFGYAVTLEYVAEAIERLQDAANKPHGGPEGFIEQWLREEGLRDPKAGA